LDAHPGVSRDDNDRYSLSVWPYATAGQVAYKLGYSDLASLTVERYEWAAAQSGDELSVLVGDYQRAGELIATADWNAALPFLEKSRSRIEPQLGKANPVVLSVWGNLHLKSGLAAARDGKRDLADTHLAEAQETAQRIGADRDDYRLCFGPTNVNAPARSALAGHLAPPAKEKSRNKAI
jgi:hypothetical protein